MGVYGTTDASAGSSMPESWKTKEGGPNSPLIPVRDRRVRIMELSESTS